MGNDTRPAARLPQNWFDLLSFVSAWEQRIGRAQHYLDACDTRLDAQRLELNELKTLLTKAIKVPQQRNPFANAAPIRKFARKLTREVKAVLKRLAEQGVASLTTRLRSDGDVEVRIVGSQIVEFDLPPLLGRLLIILAKDVPEKADGQFVAWKRRVTIEKELSEDTEGQTGTPRIPALIYRLRRRLWFAHGVNPFYVQTSRQGARFLLRRPTAPKSGGQLR